MFPPSTSTPATLNVSYAFRVDGSVINTLKKTQIIFSEKLGVNLLSCILHPSMLSLRKKGKCSLELVELSGDVAENICMNKKEWVCLSSVPGALWPVKICNGLKRGVSLNLSLDVCSVGVQFAPIVWTYLKAETNRHIFFLLLGSVLKCVK